MAKAVHRRKNGVIAPTQRAEVWERCRVLDAKGWTLAAIGNEVGLTAAAVSNALKQVRKDNLRRARRRAEAKLADIEASYLEIARDSFREFERSRLDAQKRKTITKQTEQGEESITEEVTEGRIGEPEFLRIAQQSFAAIREMYGLDAPVKQEIKGQLLVANATVAELAELLERAEQQRGAKEVERRMQEAVEKE